MIEIEEVMDDEEEQLHISPDKIGKRIMDYLIKYPQLIKICYIGVGKTGIRLYNNECVYVPKNMELNLKEEQIPDYVNKLYSFLRETMVHTHVVIKNMDGILTLKERRY